MKIQFKNNKTPTCNIQQTRMGFVYLVQPAELVGTDRYKVGHSTSSALTQLNKGYLPGTRFIIVFESETPVETEQRILSVFKNKFELVTSNNFFKGYESALKNEFTEQCLFNNKTTHVITYLDENYEFTGNDLDDLMSVQEIWQSYEIWYCNNLFDPLDIDTEPMLTMRDLIKYIKQHTRFDFTTRNGTKYATAIVNKNVMEMTD